MGGTIVSVVALGAALGSACQAHPSNPEIPDALCTPRCQRDHDCNPQVDVQACVTDCKRFQSPRVVYHREDWVASVRACAQRQPCVSDVDRFIRACIIDAERRLQPTAAALAFCQHVVTKNASCHAMGQFDVDHCLYGFKFLSDPILGQLDDCAQNSPCKFYDRCILSVIGDDPYIADRDRQEQLRTQAIPEAGPATVALRGHVQTFSGTPIAHATVCLQDSQQPCVTTDDTGAYELSAPAHQELGVTAAAEGYQSRIEPLATVGRDVANLTIGLPNDATMKSRYSAAGGTVPDTTTGFIMVSADPPRGSKTGIEGIVISIAPASGRGPVYFADTSEPDPQRTSTSTFSSALFANVQPGIVEVTFGPETVTCVPQGTGWPSPRPNSLRVPVVAGLETRVTMSCHK